MESLGEKKIQRDLIFITSGVSKRCSLSPEQCLKQRDFSWCSQVQYLTSATASKALLYSEKWSYQSFVWKSVVSNDLPWCKLFNIKPAKVFAKVCYIPTLWRVHSSFLKNFNLFFFGHTMHHVRSQFPDQGSNPSPLPWKLWVLTTGLPGKSPWRLRSS